MSKDWESKFENWGKPPSATEQDEIARTEQQIQAALAAHAPLQDKTIRLYGKGSHVRGTNVRRESDVDIAVELKGDTRTGLSWIASKQFAAKDLSDSDLNLVDVNMGYTLRELKADVFDALVTAFGSGAVTRHNKCIEVRERTTTLPADVVPCRTYTRYDSRTMKSAGVLIRPDTGSDIVNWPEQGKTNGTAKNSRTSKRYKRAVRGIKALEDEMANGGIIAPVPSFLLECAVYNVPNPDFSNASNYANCLKVLSVMAGAIQDGSASDWVEINDLKYLFRTTQNWTEADLTRYVAAAAKYLGIG